MGKSRAARKARQEKKRQNQIITWVIIVVVALLLIAGLAAVIIPNIGTGTASAEWEEFPTQEALHIEGMEPEAIPTYNTEPPTSGAHYGDPMLPAAAGFYEAAKADLNLVHSLEHGYVIIWYDCEQLSNCDTVKDQLKTVLTQTGSYKTIIMPREDMPAPVIATSWGMMYKQFDFDAAKMVDFVKNNRENSPEPTAP